MSGEAAQQYGYEELQNGTLFRHMLAGTTAGIVEHSITYPFDNLKVFICLSWVECLECNDK